MVLVAAACSSSASPSPSAAAQSLAPGASTAVTPSVGGSPIAVLGTENFYADLLAQVGGSRVVATSLLNDPNTDPHSFEASPDAAAAVADAQIVIVNGLGYDDFMQHLLAASPNSSRTVINVQDLLGLPSDVNAHVWYDPGTMPKVAQAAEAALAKIEPANAAYYSARLTAYLASLKPLTDKIAEMKAKYAGAPVAFTEPVAGYLARAIGLSVLTPEGFQKAIEDGTDPAPADVAAERDLLTGHKVRVLLYNSQTVTPLTQQIHDLAVSSGIPVVGVSETLPPVYHTYQGWQLAQMDQIEQALAKGA
jgi:zinc/manganese transport system substrate-binding protein